MIYKFSKEVSYEHVRIVEADSLEDALILSKYVPWKKGCGGEALICDRRIRIYEDKEELEADGVPVQFMDEDDMKEMNIWFD